MDVFGAFRRAAPYALVLALALAATLALGAHLSNAQPSAARPFGWDGPAKFTNGVAMVRDDLVAVVSLPSLLLGVRSLADLAPAGGRARDLAARFGLHAFALVAAVAAGTGAGVAAADPTTWNAVIVFAAAHALLAVSFLALGFLVAALAGRWALATASGVWILVTLVYERVVRLALYRTVGFERLVTGDFPTWFYGAQVVSPISSYRGVLILGERGFMDFLERAALGKATLPAYVQPWTFGAVLVVAWIALPFAVALAVCARRARARTAPASAGEPVP